MKFKIPFSLLSSVPGARICKIILNFKHSFCIYTLIKMSDPNEQKAKHLLEEADKKMKRGAGGLISFLTGGSSGSASDAAELAIKAANLFKVCC